MEKHPLGLGKKACNFSSVVRWMTERGGNKDQEGRLYKVALDLFRKKMTTNPATPPTSYINCMQRVSWPHTKIRKNIQVP